MTGGAPRLPRPSGDEAAFWDARYASSSWPTDPDPLVVETAGAIEAGRALDLGCGTGRHSIWLARQGWSVTGVDLSPVGLSMARERAAALGVLLELVEADLRSYEPPHGLFDLVLIANVHPDPRERKSMLAAAGRAVGPGGHLLLVGHHLDNLGRSGPPDPERLYELDELREALPSDLSIRRLERVERVLGSPQQPPGEASVHGREPVPDVPADVAVVAWLTR